MQISKESIMKLGADKVGFADLRKTPSGKRDGMPFGISIAVALDPKLVNDISNGPTVEYHYEYKRINDRLNDLAEKTAQCIKAKGFSAVAQTTTIVSTDKRNETNILPHKTVATLSGMGWIG
ncbi:MAG: epoxyqueuosine reductase, partial [Clostridia bacterium]|nr:epoxyqueuosine reductase [Clostridia bacterium]